jgi:hypothetical protein
MTIRCCRSINVHAVTTCPRCCCCFCCWLRFHCWLRCFLPSSRLLLLCHLGWLLLFLLLLLLLLLPPDPLL